MATLRGNSRAGPPPYRGKSDPPRQQRRTNNKCGRSALVVAALLILTCTTLLPLIVMEMPHPHELSTDSSHHSVSKLLLEKFHLKDLHGLSGRGAVVGTKDAGGKSKSTWSFPNIQDFPFIFNEGDEEGGNGRPPHADAAPTKSVANANSGDGDEKPPPVRGEGRPKSQGGIPPRPERPETLARGVSGLPMAATPALMEAKRGHIDCDVDVDFLAYWNDPQGYMDVDYHSPFAGEPTDGGSSTKYISFEPDSGGWNNIRMSMEIIVVVAMATGRTLVLPPDQPLYRLTDDKKHKQRGFADFFPLHSSTFNDHVRVISMEEFLKREGGPDGRLPVAEEHRDVVFKAARSCEFRKKSDIFCGAVQEHLRSVGLVPQLEARKDCLIFDRDTLDGSDIEEEKNEHVKDFCQDRNVKFYDREMQEAPLLHFAAAKKENRLLNHFYAFILFTDPAVDNYFKRFIRDFLRYRDQIFCAAGKIVLAIQEEGRARGFSLDEEGGGGFSSLHIRRGDFQYKKVKIPAEEWHDNTNELWLENEILFVATDERDKTFFQPMAEHHTLRFLDDYWDVAGLGALDPNYMGMIDTIVASRGRVFVGTWFSTFSGYIIRMRGYHGMTIKNSYYGTLDRKYIMHKWANPNGNYYAREWPLGWVGIDGDAVATQEREQPSAENRDVEKGLADGSQRQLLARGISGLPMSETPALVGAKRGHIECDVDVDALAYWNDPQGTRDVNFDTPFATSRERTQYLTFEPDSGGWNNIRMSLEVTVIVAAATGRTLVLPPDQPLYLLKNDKSKKQRGFADFFPLHSDAFNARVPVITSEEFLSREGGPDGVSTIPSDTRTAVLAVQSHCERRAKSKIYCGPLFDHYRKAGLVPQINGGQNCLVFDAGVTTGGKLGVEDEKRVKDFCGKRKPVFYDPAMHGSDVLHFQTSEAKLRLLVHFYNFVIFTDPVLDNHYKRFVRDFMHYHDSIFCAAGKIVLALQEEGIAEGFSVDEEGGGGYASLHVRRGDLQYKRVKIPAEEWYENLKEVWLPNEILYIATDERNKTFFDPLAKHHPVKFLDDFWDMAGLKDLDPNYMGMIDTIVASRGRSFAGTYYSTFSGFINRMRGYHGMTMKDSYYGIKDKKYSMHEWVPWGGSAFAREFPQGWVGIDGDTAPSGEIF